MSNQKLSQICSKSMITISSHEPVSRAAQLMTKHHIRHLPVTSKNKIVGIISDRDVQRAARVDFYSWADIRIQDYDFDPKYTVWDFMSAPVECIDIGAPLAKAAELMINKQISALVVKESDDPVGIVTSNDLLRVIAMENSKTETLTSRLEASFMQTPVGSFIEQLSSSGL